MATLPSLRPTGTVSNTNVSVVGTTAHEAIDDDPNSVPNVTDYVHNTQNGNFSANTLILDVTNMPADFASMDSSLTLRGYVASVNRTDDTLTLQGRIESSAGVAYTNTVTLSTNPSSVPGAVTGALTVNAAGLAATKTDWDGARLWLDWSGSVSMGNDSADLRLYAVEIDGTYTQVNPNATVTPAVIATTVAVPQAGVSVLVTPAAIAVTTSLPAASPALGATVQPAVVPVTAALPAVNIVTTVDVVTLTATMRMGNPMGNPTPLISSLPGGMSASANTFELGWSFQVGATPITISTLRVYRPTTVALTAKLWDSSGNLLRSVAITPVVNAWTAGNITPIVLSASTTYIISLDAAASYYSPLGGEVTFWNGITFVEGRYNTTLGSFPNNVVVNRVYGVVDAVGVLS